MAAVFDEIRKWFEASGVALSEELGSTEGKVERFATPRQGLFGMVFVAGA